MTVKYDAYYAAGPDALGPPTKALVKVLGRELAPASHVLDLGCGQGRDAVWLARAGHCVTGIDISSVGVAQLNALAEAEGLPIRAIVAAVEGYEPDETPDCLLFDRSLHMLEADAREAAFARLAGYLPGGGLVVVADEAPNLPGLRAALSGDWQEIWAARSGFALRRA